jgi:hypothetical protein
VISTVSTVMRGSTDFGQEPCSVEAEPLSSACSLSLPHGPPLERFRESFQNAPQLPTAEDTLPNWMSQRQVAAQYAQSSAAALSRSRLPSDVTE